MELNYILQKIQLLMEQRKWTMYRLAKESGIPYSSLNSLFQKNNQPTISTLEKICSGFGITMADFFCDDLSYLKPSILLTEREKKLLDKFRTLKPKNQKLLLSILEMIIQSC